MKLLMPSLTLLMFSVAMSQTVFAVDWEQQAERLQLVNAAMLDAAPVGTPIGEDRALVIGADVSLLPKVNPKVGAKSEDVPSPPAHLVPTLGYQSSLAAGGSWHGVYQLAVGYLPAGGEKLLGIDAAATQSLWRASLGIEGKQAAWGVVLGLQSTSAEVTGAITEEDADDRFEVATQIPYLSGYTSFGKSGLWLGAVVGQHHSASDFFIEVDDTSLALEDSAGLAQVSLGLRLDAIDLAISEIWIAERVLMPRLSAAYRVVL